MAYVHDHKPRKLEADAIDRVFHGVQLEVSPSHVESGAKRTTATTRTKQLELAAA